MKFFINDPHHVVNEGIEGLLTNPELTRLDTFPEIKVVLRTKTDKSQVSVISGGGSGHEPAHAGFVGQGMLTAAVCGEIFASPSVEAVLSAILATTGDNGCVLIIKNYTGDRLNFGLAAEQARAMGYKVETVIVGDDIALGKDIQRRGLAGTLFVHKTAGALAASGASLEKVAAMARKVAGQTYSIGLSLEEGQKFRAPEASRLKPSEAELGLGIHGEPGVETIAMDKADALMKKAVDRLTMYLPDNKKKYALLLNNLGSVTPVEMNVLRYAFRRSALARQVKYIVGPAPLMTSLNMNGFSLSLLELDNDITEALLHKASPASWCMEEFGEITSIPGPELPDIIPFTASTDEKNARIIRVIAEELIASEKELNALDEKVGDGDAGSTFATGARKILELKDRLPLADTEALFTSLGRILARETGGSSGVLLSIMFTGAGNAYREELHPGKALLRGLQRMKALGGAEEGQRTMIDALQPAFNVLSENGSLERAAQKARAGADKTREIVDTDFGRSSYLSEKSLKGIPDPGAEAVARVLEKLAEIKA